MSFLVGEDRHYEVFGDRTVGVLGTIDKRPIPDEITQNSAKRASDR